MYRTQIIVTSELSPEENLYLRCLTNKRKDGATPMYCEGLFELFGTSVQEVEERATERATKIATEKATEKANNTINELKATIADKDAIIAKLTAQLNALM